ncbi:MAG: hypothetical protein WCC50_08315, partial [Pseudolabrys sp.]
MLGLDGSGIPRRPSASEVAAGEMSVLDHKRTSVSRPMSALGQKQALAVQQGVSALPPKADMCGATR